MSDDRTNRVERENAEALHFIMTPVRMLMNFIKFAFMVVVIVILVLVNQVGWVVDLGDRQRARDARQNRLEAQLDPSPGGQWSVIDVDFRTQPDPTDHLARENRFWDDTRPLYMAQMEEDVNWRTKAFTTTWLFGWGWQPRGRHPLLHRADAPRARRRLL